MPILSRRNAPKLLRSVNNQPHAGTGDHEEDTPRKASIQQTTKPYINSEPDIFADPISSSDEKETQPPPSMSQGSTTSTQEGARAGRAANGTPGKSPKGKARAMRVPRQGAFRTGLKHKDSFGEGDKENSQEGPSSSDGKGEMGGAVYFGMGDTPPKKQRTKNVHAAPVAGKRETDETVYFGMGDTPRKKQKTKNVHAAPVVGFNRKSFGKDMPSKLLSIPKKNDFRHHDDLDNALSKIIDQHEGHYVDLSDDELSPPAKKRPQTYPRLPAGYTISSAPTITTKGSETSPPNSPLTSVSDYDDEELNTFEHESLKRDQDSTCTLCQDEVDPAEQTAFWAVHHDRTVRDQMLFCKTHKRSKAQTEYTAHGFPEIDWASLPCRIRKFRPTLISILRNDTPKESTYRTKHAERLSSGKAAALPSKRRTRQAQASDQDRGESVDTASSSSTGYYGPRGKRVMMEVMTADLSDVIREVAAKDPVVGRSGFAMFLQAVLVPELTLLLVMQDMDVGVGEAKGVVERSGEVGALVNEEVDDEVGVGSGEEEDDEDDEDDEENDENEEEEEEEEES